MSRGNGLLLTTRSRAKETLDERIYRVCLQYSHAHLYRMPPSLPCLCRYIILKGMPLPLPTYVYCGHKCRLDLSIKSSLEKEFLFFRSLLSAQEWKIHAFVFLMVYEISKNAQKSVSHFFCICQHWPGSSSLPSSIPPLPPLLLLVLCGLERGKGNYVNLKVMVRHDATSRLRSLSFLVLLKSAQKLGRLWASRARVLAHDKGSPRVMPQGMLASPAGIPTGFTVKGPLTLLPVFLFH